MKQFLLFSIVVFLFMRFSCGKPQVDRIFKYPYIIENKLNTDIRIVLDDAKHIAIQAGKQYQAVWYMSSITGDDETYFNYADFATVYIEDKTIKVWQSEGKMKTMNFPEEPYTTNFGIFNGSRWSLEGGTYYYRITSADTVLVKKPISKEQPAAATATSSGTPAS